MSDKQDYYEVLGISKTTSQAEIKQAYRNLALKYHPDRNKAADAETKFKKINEAYEVLSNPKKRETYDQFGSTAFAGGFDGQGSSGFEGFTGQGPFTYTYTSGNNPFSGFGGEGFSDPFDIFESFFGSASPFRSASRRSKPHYSLKIDFMDAARGGEKTVIINGKERVIKIPAGADDGTRVRYKDFDVSFDVLADPIFRREGDNVIVNQEIGMAEAALGTTIEVPTIEGPVKLKIRPGTQPGALIRLREKGISNIRTGRRGDQYIRLIIKIPERLSREQRRLLEELKEQS